MTDIKIKDIRVFSELEKGLSSVNQQIAPALDAAENSLRSFIHDLEVDLKESQTSVQKIGKQSDAVKSGNATDKPAQEQELSREAGMLNQKIQELKSYISTSELLLVRFDTLKRKSDDMRISAEKGCAALGSFQELAQRYLKVPSSNGNSSITSGSVSQYSDNYKLRELGDTFHFTSKGTISQFDLHHLENQVKSEVNKGNKLSIDGISQSDFAILESNGYTIQQIRPNEYSAFKTVEK
jgi:hypothetical protein